jgi:hypothetical protein
MSIPMSRRRNPGTTRYDTSEVSTRTSTAAGSRRRIRRPTNRDQEIVPVVHSSVTSNPVMRKPEMTKKMSTPMNPPCSGRPA